MTKDEREIFDKLSRLADLPQLISAYQKENVEFFTAIIAHLDDLDTLRERREKNAQRMAKKRAQDNENVCAQTSLVRTQKEEERKDEKERGEIPPHTPLKEGGEKEEKKGEEVISSARACEAVSWKEEPLPPVITSTRTPPTFGQVLWKAHRAYHFHDDQWLKEWFDTMTACYWKDKEGHVIGNWCLSLSNWIRNKPAIDKFRDPGRIYDCRDPKPHQRIRSDNWRGMREEDIEDVLS